MKKSISLRIWTMEILLRSMQSTTGSEIQGSREGKIFLPLALSFSRPFTSFCQRDLLPGIYTGSMLFDASSPDGSTAPLTNILLE